jgi:hypothetical protein
MAKKYYGDKMKEGGEMKGYYMNDYAGMPQEVIHKKYPKGSYSCPGGYRDNREGIDAYAKENYNRLKKQHRKPSDAS